MSEIEIIEYYQADAFTTELFGGNPAGVCVLHKRLPDNILQLIAAENNLSETAFMLPCGDGFELRWFTPLKEVDLCGHATLAAAFIQFTLKGYAGKCIEFYPGKKEYGILKVERDPGGVIMLDFPAWPVTAVADVPKALIAGLRVGGDRPLEVYKSCRDYLVLLENEDVVRNVDPDFSLLSKVDDCLGIIVTARGTEDVDYVLRFFEPGAGVNEDPATGSAHCTLIPFWSQRLGKKKMKALQLSTRGGIFACEMRENERVGIGGHTVLYSRGGELSVPAM